MTTNNHMMKNGKKRGEKANYIPELHNPIFKTKSQQILPKIDKSNKQKYNYT